MQRSTQSPPTFPAEETVTLRYVRYASGVRTQAVVTHADGTESTLATFWDAQGRGPAYAATLSVMRELVAVSASRTTPANPGLDSYTVLLYIARVASPTSAILLKKQVESQKNISG